MDCTTGDWRKRFNSAMTYDMYLDTFDQPPQKPIIKPKEAPLNVEPLALDPPKGPKLQQQALHTYQPDEIIYEENSEATDSKLPSPRFKNPPCFKAMVQNDVRVRSQSENIGYSVLKFLCKKK